MLQRPGKRTPRRCEAISGPASYWGDCETGRVGGATDTRMAELGDWLLNASKAKVEERWQQRYNNVSQFKQQAAGLPVDY